jgi:hypothetical protein
VAYLEGYTLLVFYYLSSSEIWFEKRRDFGEKGLI